MGAALAGAGGCVSRRRGSPYRQLLPALEQLPPGSSFSNSNCVEGELGKLERVFVVKNAKGVLIHLRSTHRPGLLAQDYAVFRALKSKEDRGQELDVTELVALAKVMLRYSPNSLDEINTAQGNIHHFLTRHLPKRLYLEGLPGGEVLPQTRIQREYHVNQLLMGAITGVAREDLRQFASKYQFLPGAGFTYPLSRGGIEVVGADIPDIDKRTKAFYRGEVPKSALFEEREPVIVANTLSCPDPCRYRFLWLGSDHDLRDDVREYNAQHPENRFNFAEFTPRSAREEKPTPLSISDYPSITTTD